MAQDQIVNRLVHQVLAIRKKDSGEYCEGNLELNGFRFSKFYINFPDPDFGFGFQKLGNGSNKTFLSAMCNIAGCCGE